MNFKARNPQPSSMGTMALPASDSAIWEKIEQSESYLVCCMYEKAASLASSVLQCLCKTKSTESLEDDQLYDMLEASGMVLVQCLKELGRTTEILNELRTLFGSVAAVPVQVLLTGSCFQISEGYYSPSLREFLEEFLCKWRYVDGKSYVLSSEELNQTHLEGCSRHSVVEIEKYLEVVEVYTVSLLGRVLNETELAISWVEKAELPEEKRQELLRRLHSLHSLKASNSLQEAESLQVDENKAHTDSGKDSNISGHERSSRASIALNGGNNTREAIVKFYKRIDPCFWWFRLVALKVGKTRLVISQGTIVLSGSLIFLIYYVLRKKRANIKRMASRRALALIKAVKDMWQLAFSVQVNPLAAVQPLPVATRGNR